MWKLKNADFTETEQWAGEDGKVAGSWIMSTKTDAQKELSSNVL